MLGLFNQSVSRPNLSHNKPIHSFHKHKSNANIIAIDSLKQAELVNCRPEMSNRISHKDRHSKAEAKSKDRQDRQHKQDTITYMSYPYIFQNKISNIQRILKTRRGVDPLGGIIGKARGNKVSIFQSGRHFREY